MILKEFNSSWYGKIKGGTNFCGGLPSIGATIEYMLSAYGPMEKFYVVIDSGPVPEGMDKISYMTKL